MWEYATVTESTIAIDRFVLQLNGYGSLGWEVVSIASPDKTIGLNALVAVLKRQVVAWTQPESLEPEWHPDPTGRFERRYWDGLRWTQHVAAADGSTSTDFPNRR